MTRHWSTVRLSMDCADSAAALVKHILQMHWPRVGTLDVHIERPDGQTMVIAEGDRASMDMLRSDLTSLGVDGLAVDGEAIDIDLRDDVPDEPTEITVPGIPSRVAPPPGPEFPRLPEGFDWLVDTLYPSSWHVRPSDVRGALCGGESRTLERHGIRLVCQGCYRAAWAGAPEIGVKEPL